MEYAILVAVLIGGLLICISITGDATSNSFGRLVGFGQDTEAHAFVASGEPVQTVTAEETVADLALQAKFWRWGTLMAVLGCGVVSLYFIRRRRVSDDEENEIEEETQEDVDTLVHKRQGIYGILANDVGKLLHSRLLVQHVMSAKLTTVLPNAPRSQVSALMATQAVRHLLVCDKRHKLAGIISDRDMMKSTGKTAQEIMTANPITVAPDTPISPAVTLLVNRRISCLPVCDDGALVGVLTTTDMLMVLQCALQALQKVATEVSTDLFNDSLSTAKTGNRISTTARELSGVAT